MGNVCSSTTAHTGRCESIQFLPYIFEMELTRSGNGSSYSIKKINDHGAVVKFHGVHVVLKEAMLNLLKTYQKKGLLSNI